MEPGRELDPYAAVLEVLSADGILAAEDGSLNAARPRVVDGNFAASDDVFACVAGHGSYPVGEVRTPSGAGMSIRFAPRLSRVQ